MSKFTDRIKRVKGYFSRGELALWCGSVALIIAAFLLFDRGSVLTLVASLIGVTSLIFNAKGNPFGQVLVIAFSVLYGIISYSFAYYGEMITYMTMTAPMAVLALISWLRNPYSESKAEVRVNRRLAPREIVLMLLLAAAVTTAFYFILRAFGTANLIPSTVSVATSFVAVYLTARRSPYFAVAYAANDIVLIILWGIAAFTDVTYISVIICFVTFLANDVYTFFNWLKIAKRQNGE